MGLGHQWTGWAIQQIEADFNRSADTHLIKLDMPILKRFNIDVYFKDESIHPSRSLKHRLARSLFLYGICSGWIQEGSTIVEASSGSTAVSEAYFARLLKLPYIAVMPETTSPEKIKEIEFFGGKIHLVKDPSQVYSEAARLADESNGHYMDQFTFAERATDWRGNNNIAESIFSQMAEERFPTPEYIVVGAGTGGTSATIGRFIRFRKKCIGTTKLIVSDPENSVFYDYFQSRDRGLRLQTASRIEGIGRPRVEPSFIAPVVDEVKKIPDAASIASARFLESYLGKKCGASTGTNFYAVVELASQMIKDKKTGSLVTLICDPGERYLHSYYNDDWIKEKDIDIAPYLDKLKEFADSGRL